MFSFQIARRYLLSKKSHHAINIISGVSVFGVAIATAALVCILSVFNGFQDMVADLFTTFDPELKVLPAQGKYMAADEKELTELKKCDKIAVYMETVEDNALLMVNNRQKMVTIKGVGTCTITAMMQEHKNFKKQEANITFTVNVAAREITADNVTVGEQGENGVPEITVSVEAPIGILTPAETTDYQLAYYDNPEDRNTVTVEQMLAAPGEYVAVLTFFGNYAGYVEKTITVGSAQGPIPGDVNAGGDVEPEDVDKFITNIMSGNLPTDPTSDDFTHYDANQDGKIDIADAQAIMNLAMGLNADGTAKNAAPARRNAPAQAEQAVMSIESEDMGGGIVRYALNVEGDFAFTGFQADVKTSGRIVTVALANSEMRMRSGILSNGTHRILGLPGTTEQQADGAIAYVFVQGGAATFENVVLTTADARSIAAVGQTTGVNEVIEVNGVNDNSVYDLSGRKVNAAQKGIVIIGGKKVVIK